MKLSFNWLKDYVKIKISAEEIARKLTMAGLEVKRTESTGGDFMLETEITTNRPDWLSHLGVAREIHAVTGGTFCEPPAAHQISKAVNHEWSASVQKADRDLCPYYSARLLEGVEWGETPDFIKKRLELCGIRSINFPVDITNYVLLEYGQPLHAFDADRLVGKQIIARRAKLGEKIIAIDGVAYDLKENDLIIADAHGPVAIGGVMGGRESEVNSQTKNILLESAFFSPSTVRRTSRRLKLTSESSYRFERRVDPYGVNQARERAVYLFAKYGKVARVSGVIQDGKLPLKVSRIILAASEIKRILGVNIPMSQVLGHLKRLGLKVAVKGRTSIQAQAPSFRSDLTRPIDLIEEIARIHQYDRIPETLPEMIPHKPNLESQFQKEQQVRNLCVGMGLFEIIPFNFVNPAILQSLNDGSEQAKWLGLDEKRWVGLANPQNKEWSILRPTLSIGMLDVVRRNLYAGETEVRCFEVGNRYLAEDAQRLPHEELMLAIGLSGTNENWIEKKREIGFYDLKGMIETVFLRLGVEWSAHQAAESPIYEPYCSVSFNAGDQRVGFAGAVSEKILKIFDIQKPVYYGVISLEKVLALGQKTKKVCDLPKFPSSPRDLTAIVGEDIKSESIVRKIRQLGGDLVQDVNVFDYFKGSKIPQHKKSLSFRIVYQSLDRTLHNDDVNQLHFSIVDALAKEFGVELPKIS